MTTKEAILQLQGLLNHCDSMQCGADDYPIWKKDVEALKIAIAALRSVSREQVEKVWRGEWNYSHTTETDHFAVVKCSKCGHEAFAIALYVKDENFCPHCGAPMTDEAVQMVMERL